MKPANHILWLLCGGAALALHAGAAALFFKGDLSPQEVAPVGQKGVMVELAFEGATAGGLSQAGNVSEKTSSTVKEVQKAPPKKTQQAKPLKPTPQLKPKEPAPETPKKVPATVSEQTMPTVPEKPVEEVSIVTEEVATSANIVGVDDGVDVEAVTNSVGGAGGENASANGVKGDGNADQSGGLGGAIKSYEDLVQVWIHKHLLYPKSARRRQLTGTVLVRFILTSDGQLISAEIVKNSSYGILNKSALKTIKRAVPFPGFPKEFNRENRVFVIPIEYKAG